MNGRRAVSARQLGLVVRPSSPIPPYYQVAEQLEDAIAQGVLQVGDWLPSYGDLCTVTHLSEPTIRSAVRYLARHGLVTCGRAGVMVIAAHRSGPQQQGC